MIITATHVTGTAYVVAHNETTALEEFGAGKWFTTEDTAIREERGRNDLRYGDGPELNTYKITVTAEKVH